MSQSLTNTNKMKFQTSLKFGALVVLAFACLSSAAPQDFDFNALVDLNNPLVVQARPAASAVAVERQGAAATNVPVAVPAPQGHVETCPNFETPFHTVSTCRGVSELIQDGSCEPQVTWSKGSMCDAVCEVGYGFFNEPAPKYSCDQGGAWNPIGKAPECYEIVPVHSANLQFKITYKQPNIENLQHQFDGLVYKYNDIFCPYPEECGIGDLQIKSVLDAQGSKLSEVIITIDTPVYNITDQTGFIDLVREAVLTVNQDNAFMTLIDYDNIELVLPSLSGTNNYKAEPMLCCHSCPDGHAYRLGHCVLCPPGGPCDNATAT